MAQITLRPEAIEKFCEEKTYNKYIKANKNIKQAWYTFMEVNISKAIKYHNNNPVIQFQRDSKKQNQLNYLYIKNNILDRFIITMKELETSRPLLKEILYLIYSVKKNQQLNTNRMQSLG